MGLLICTGLQYLQPGDHMTRYLKVIEKVTGINLCMHPANERRRYIVTSSLIGWAHTQNDPWRQVHWGPVGDQLGTVSVTSWGQFYKWWLTPINIMFREWHHTQLSIIREWKNKPGTTIFHYRLLHGIVYFFHKFHDDIWNPSRVTAVTGSLRSSSSPSTSKNLSSMAISNIDLLQGTVNYPTKLWADTWNPSRGRTAWMVAEHKMMRC